MSDRQKALLDALRSAKLKKPGALRAKTTQTPSMTETLYSPYGKYGATEPGNLDLTARPHAVNPDGSISTVRSMGVNLENRNYLIPTVSEDGRIMEPDEAIDEYYRTGNHLGVYDSQEASDRAAQSIHEDQEAHMPRNTLLDLIKKKARRR